MIDFTNCKIDHYKAYSGANGQKICVLYDGVRYMLKFPPQATRNKSMSYSNGCLSEYLACHIFASMGFNNGIQEFSLTQIKLNTPPSSSPSLHKETTYLQDI